MPFFSYKGRDSGGALVHGVIEAADSSSVANQLAGDGVIPLDIQPHRAKPAHSEPGPGQWLDRLRAPNIGHVDVLMFSRQMYTLLKAGVPIMGALKGLEQSTDNRSFARVIAEIQEGLDSGRPLAACLARHPRVFSHFYVAMVTVGELTGALERVFLRLFHHLEFEKAMREQIKSALRYPSFVLGTMAVALVIINLFVIPAFARVYQGMKAELPAMTRALIGFSDFMLSYWPVLLGGALGAALLARSFLGTVHGRLLWDRYKLRLPIAGTIVLKATLARFARSLSLALNAGVPAVQALTIVAQTVDNQHVGRSIDAMRIGVERGESILRTAAAAQVFTPVVLQMIAVGEESGALDDLMAEIAEMYQREVEYELASLSSQIEPVLIVGLGILVLILAIGVFLPIWDLGNVALGRK